MGWVNNVITVQALPQDRHISWPTHPFSPSSLFSIRYFASHPHSPRHEVSLALCCVRQALSGIHSRRSLSRYFLLPPSPLPGSFSSMHARRAYMHVRTCHVQIAGRRLTASRNTQAKHLAETRTFGKTTTLYWFRESCFSRLFPPPHFTFFSPLTPCRFFFARANIVIFASISARDSNNGRPNRWIAS